MSFEVFVFESIVYYPDSDINNDYNSYYSPKQFHYFVLFTIL